MLVPRRMRPWIAAAAAAVAALGIASSAGAAPPVISGADGDRWGAAAPPSYTVSAAAAAPVLARTRFDWRASNGQTGTSRVVPFDVVLDEPPLGEGPGTLVVTQRPGGALPAETATRSFVVDRTPPGAVTLAVPATAPAGTEVPVSWSAGEPGARFTLRVRLAGGEVVQGPVETQGTSARVVPLAAGAYSVGVVQTDAAGNAGPEAVAALTVAPAPVPAFAAPVVQAAARPARPTYRLPATNASRLKPRPAAGVTARRPILRWRAAAGARFYNVQIFRVDTRVRTQNGAPRLLKVKSLFPRGQRLRAPLLARGACYVWRVWPYGRSGFTPKPLGLSNFCIARPRAPR